MSTVTTEQVTNAYNAMLMPFALGERRFICLQAQNGNNAYKFDFSIKRSGGYDYVQAPTLKDCTTSMNTILGGKECWGSKTTYLGGQQNTGIFEYL
jgi:hypothetical protein